MHITLTLYGGLQELVGARTAHLTVDDGARAADVLTLAAARWPRLAERLPTVAVACGDSLVPRQTPLVDGDELGLLPPVCGG